ncbi:tRNA (N6-isopentenyl adenosine(37)-C2)-methylthiotransferase MiaB [Hymenobacter sp. BT770]|uniref:tRNA (N6-isopentenyl adenosine(37)-C2)-methylthiotransferase MiaB n=1 Tax=Hymenobacter sp. BT770 TaxID=2886942 RepID=UPI001D12E289|nr:tRNA (N6-isopentenyl adenosine(37)-C2)-methylthiotransferase MiaB [Hymenobacter sp. BT770]MCC3154546.1 tRNA (N6-isopentenyl adenosine(37)-C2)-methylthiotransferase MiaB [Hymenobacter sp. BT770]MDO3416600.1 tRNA (N6-isopentenyl adenosine(37)-C2)-methylthiotransferase MiaB [Hymenobacter sp. BT770]
MSQALLTLDFLDKVSPTPEATPSGEVRVSAATRTGRQRKLYIESYGCQMNFSDSEIVSSILFDEGFDTTDDLASADLVLLNTCSIREKAEQTVRMRLSQINSHKKRNPGLLVGVLGCMAERLKSKFLEEEKIVDLVVGPDAYRDLPQLISQVDGGQKGVNVLLSREETYADITPVRLNSNGVSAFISIMRGCDNMCSFCVVPFTRGRERSRDAHSILREAADLVAAGYKEVTLLGQNVDSYKWASADGTEHVNFAQLLEKVALVSPELRVRFSTSHPKDITDEVLHTMARYDNICKFIHLPAQSGNSRVLALMNRTYDRPWYEDRVRAIRRILGEDCAISSDMISGFCTETEEEHQDTLSLMEFVRYDMAYMFFYSERPGTLAARKLTDDIPLEVKKRRLQEIIDLQQLHSAERNQRGVGRVHQVLVENFSKRSKEHLSGRNSQNQVVIFPKQNFKKGDYVNVLVHSASASTMLGEAV